MEATTNVRTDGISPCEERTCAELIGPTIMQLVEEKENNSSGNNSDEEDRRLLFARLLSQLESNNDVDKFKPSPETKAVTSSTAVEAGTGDEKDCEGAEMTVEEIVKELRSVRRQNTITHWLLSIMIVVTAVWQVTEFSLLLAVKQTVKNPFKAIGGFITGTWGRLNESADARKGTPLSHQIKIPDLPNAVDLPSLGLNDDNKD